MLEPPLACLNVSVNQILGVRLLMCALNWSKFQYINVDGSHKQTINFQKLGAFKGTNLC